jgi:hypothetical protein
MPYEFKLLDNNPHSILVTFMGKVTQDEIEAEATEALGTLKQCTTSCYMIVDLTQKPTFMANILKMPKVLETVKNEHFGWVVLVGVNRVANFWVEILGRSLGLKSKAFMTMEDAHIFVNSLREAEKESPIKA